MRKLIILIILSSFLQSCVTPRVETIWKAEYPLPYQHKKILVVAIVTGNNDSLQAEIEKAMVQQLVSYGYEAVSYSNGFSVYEMSRFTQEAAYFALCDKGIDAVLTLANVDPSLTISLKKGTRTRYPASFYYNHIWDYRNLKTGPIDNKSKPSVWECIMFDLPSLEQQSVLQVKSLSPLKKQNEAIWLSQNIIGKMVAEKIIRKQNITSPGTIKGF
ncbi:hypothetical protein CAP36_11715 [Chitinophagaceae bacterium IBVUCB2]|nr:hypothetical protein CAP36_11715 [Chitinophagaceae bacterium IBVUCB2]